MRVSNCRPNPYATGAPTAGRGSTTTGRTSNSDGSQVGRVRAGSGCDVQGDSSSCVDGQQPPSPLYSLADEAAPTSSSGDSSADGSNVNGSTDGSNTRRAGEVEFLPMG